ncbi:MAG: hypothetical protein K2N91_08790, partial [Muribaculaceae bacterium]|nr:hypothetical protein [Muribaculaceae bacterium]
NEVLASLPSRHPQLQRVADRCMDANPKRRYHDVDDLKLALTDRSSNRLYIIIIIFLAIMTAILGYLNAK